MHTITTIGQLKKSGYQSKSIKQELRDNLIASLKAGKKTFDGIIGYDTSVIPDVERAILSKHNILLLGLRGQAKTRLARQMVNLLDEYIPVVKGSEILDDPLQPFRHCNSFSVWPLLSDLHRQSNRQPLHPV